MNQSPENITNILERITDAFVALDKNWCYTYLNKKAAAFLNKKPEELIGKNIWQENPEWVGSPFQKAYFRAIEEQKIIYHEEYNQAWDMWFQTNIYPSPNGLTVYFNDITERKKTEKKIGDLQSKMDAAIRIGQIGYWDWDIAKDEIFWSDRMYDIYNVDRKTSLKYDTVLSRVHPDDRSFHNELVAERIKNKDKSPFEYRVQWPDGTIRHVLVQMEVLSNEKEEAVKFQGTVIDITERKKADALLESEKKVMEMIATGKKQKEILNTIALNYESNASHTICSILLLDEDGLHLRHGAGPHLPDEYNDAIDGVAIGPAVGSCGTAAYTKEIVIVSDIEKDPLWSDFQDLALRFGLKACWSIPILDNNKKVLGTFAIYYKDIRKPSPEDFTLIERTANQVKIAIERYSNEARLKKSEERYRSLIEQASDAIMITDQTGNFLDVNTSLCSMFGYTKEELLRTNIRTLIDPEHLKTEPMRFDELIRGRHIFSQRRMKHKNGTIIIVEANVKKLPDGRILAIARDITDRTRTQDEIKKFNERFEMIAATTQDAIWEWNLETNELWANKMHQSLYGLTLDDPVPTDELWEQKIHPDDREAVVKDLEKTFASDKTVWVSEYRFQTPGGEYINMYDRSYIIRNAEGKIVRTMGSMMDITDRKNAEQLVKENEERYRSLVEQASDGILVTDLQRNILDVNSGLCNMFGYARKEVLQKNVTLFLDPQNLKEQPLRFNQLQKDIPLLLERRAIHKNGNMFEIELNTKLIGDGKTLSIIRNVSERKQAEQLLRESEERYRALVENAPEALVVLDVEKRKFVSVSQSAVALFKMSKEELLKIGPAELSPEYQPDGKLSAELIPVNIKNAIEGGKPSFEWTHCDSEGNLIPCEVRLVRLPAENQILIRGSIIDITERKKAQDLILKEKQLSEAIIDSIPGVFTIRDPNNLLRWNKQFEILSGYDDPDEIRKLDTIKTFYDKEEGEKVYEAIKKVYTEGYGNIEAIVQNKNGQKIPFYFVARRIYYEGRPCMISIGIDISDRKKAEEKVREASEQLRQLSAHLQNIREEERTHMAREIHDELGQQLTVMKMDVSWLHDKLGKTNDAVRQRTEELKKMLDQTVITVRRIASELRPSLLDDMGLGAAIDWHLSEFEKRAGVKTEFDKMKKELPLPDAIKTGLFRIVQESLTNVGRYANAEKVFVSLQQKNGQLILAIKDNGIGFDKEQIAAKKTLGILGMKERTIMMGGTYEISSTFGKGTVVTVKVPFDE